MLKESLHAIFNKSTSDIDNVVFSVSIEVTRVTKYLQLSNSYKSVMGGAHPNHFLSLEGKTKVEVLSIIENDKMVMEEDIKIAVISMQLVCVVFFPYGVLCGRPQTKKRFK